MEELKKMFDELVVKAEKIAYQNAELPDHFFNEIAEKLMCEYVLSINGNKYQFAEIEFYLNDIQNSLDPFTHKQDKEIKQTGVLRFHDSGVDISMGLKNNQIKLFGGILIRSLISVDKPDELTTGPRIVVNTLFSYINILYSEINKINLEKLQPAIIKGSIISSFRINLNPFGDVNVNNFEASNKLLVKKLNYRFKKFRYLSNSIFINKALKTKNPIDKYSILSSSFLEEIKKFKDKNDLKEYISSNINVHPLYKGLDNSAIFEKKEQYFAGQSANIDLITLYRNNKTKALKDFYLMGYFNK